MALTWHLEKEHRGGVDHLRTEPPKAGVRIKQGRSEALPGWHYAKKQAVGKAEKGTPSAGGWAVPSTDGEMEWGAPAVTASELEAANAEQDMEGEEQQDVDADSQEPVENATETTESAQANMEMEDEEDEEDDGEGWLNPDNIDVMMEDGGFGATVTMKEEISVGCVTTDFAMQNVLLQMGLNVVSVDGMLVRKVKQYVLKCEACFKTSTQMEALFCPTCGNNTLFKVSVNVSADGVSHYEMHRKRYNLRGTKFSIPMPKGGRNSTDLVLREDQLPKQYHTKEVDLMDPDANNWTFNTAGPGKTGGRNPKVGHGRKNPNEVKGKVRGKNKRR